MSVSTATSSPNCKPLKSIFKSPKQSCPQVLKISRGTIAGQSPRRTTPSPVQTIGRRPRNVEQNNGREMPTELLMTLLDYVQEDKETIRTCCIVCRSWLPCARYFLIPNKFSVNELNVSDFFDIICSPYATIGSYIYHISIQTRQINILLDHSLSFITDDTSTDSVRPALDIAACLQCLQATSSQTLQSLILRDIGALSMTDFDILIPILSGFTALTQLELSRCLFLTIDDLFAVICARPTLQKVVLENIIIQDVYEPWPADIRLPRRLTHITLQTTYQSEILLWILAQSFIPPFSHVCLGGIGQTPRDQEITNRFLATLGPHLKNLKIYISHWIETVTLQHNTRLQSLSLSRCSMVQRLPKLLTMLDQISSPLIAHISLRFVNNPDELESVPWDHVARLFRDAKFHALKSLRIRCCGRSEVMKNVVRYNFSALHQRGVLQVRCDSDLVSGDTD